MPWSPSFTLFLDDGDVDDPASNLCDAGGDIDGLHLQLLLIIIILPDEEWDTDINQLHSFLEFHHAVSIWGKGQQWKVGNVPTAPGHSIGLCSTPWSEVTV